MRRLTSLPVPGVTSMSRLDVTRHGAPWRRRDLSAQSSERSLASQRIPAGSHGSMTRIGSVWSNGFRFAWCSGSRRIASWSSPLHMPADIPDTGEVALSRNDHAFRKLAAERVRGLGLAHQGRHRPADVRRQLRPGRHDPFQLGVFVVCATHAPRYGVPGWAGLPGQPATSILLMRGLRLDVPLRKSTIGVQSPPPDGVDQPRFGGYTSGMKTAVSIPDEVYAETERLARRLNKSRSEVYSLALAEYVARHAPEHVTEAMDRVCTEVGGEIDEFAGAAARRILERSPW